MSKSLYVAKHELPEPPDTDDNAELCRHWHGVMVAHYKLTLEAAARLGDVLCEQKQLSERKFKAWCEAELPFSYKSATRYMKLAENAELLLEYQEAVDGEGSVTGALKYLATLSSDNLSPVSMPNDSSGEELDDDCNRFTVENSDASNDPVKRVGLDGKARIVKPTPTPSSNYSEPNNLPTADDDRPFDDDAEHAEQLSVAYTQQIDATQDGTSELAERIKEAARPFRQAIPKLTELIAAVDELQYHEVNKSQFLPKASGFGHKLREAKQRLEEAKSILQSQSPVDDGNGGIITRIDKSTKGNH